MWGNILLVLSSGLLGSLSTLLVSEWIHESRQLKRVYQQDMFVLSEISLNLKYLDEFIEMGVRDINPIARQLISEAVIEDKNLVPLLKRFFDNLSPSEQLISGTVIIELANAVLRQFYGILLKFDEISKVTRLILQNENLQIMIDYALLKSIVEAHKFDTEQMHDKLNGAISSGNIELAGNILITHIGSIRNIYRNGLRLGSNIESELQTMTFKKWKRKYKELSINHKIQNPF